MEGVAELVEECLDLTEGEQRGLGGRGLGEVGHDADVRPDVLAVGVDVLLLE